MDGGIADVRGRRRPTLTATAGRPPRHGRRVRAPPLPGPFERESRGSHRPPWWRVAVRAPSGGLALDEAMRR